MSLHRVRAAAAVRYAQRTAASLDDDPGLHARWLRRVEEMEREQRSHPRVPVAEEVVGG